MKRIDALQRLLTLNVAALFWLLTPSTRADVVLFSNLGQATANGQGTYGTYVLLASDFLTGASASTVDAATLLMNNPDFVAHTFTFSLYGDSGANTPGSLVGSFNNFTLPAFTPYGNYSAVSSGISLAANTPYWAVLQDHTNPMFDSPIWRDTASQATDAGSVFSTIPATSPEIAWNGFSWVNGAYPNFKFSLSGTELAAVPEPSQVLSMLLVVAGIAGFLLIRPRIKAAHRRC